MNAQINPCPVAVITGASSGIGAVYADRFAARGHDLVLVARRGDRLAALGERLWARYGVTVRPLVADLSTEPGIAAVEALLENDDGVTVLVNNAGLSRLGRFIDLSPADHNNLLMVNAVAPSRLARAVLPGFVARDTGTIINIASANAVSPYPGTTVYSATKAFILSLSLGLQNEVEGTGVVVQAVVPASTATEVWDGMGIDLKDLPPETVMPTEIMVDAALAGLDLGEAITFPSLPDPALVANFVTTGRDLFAAAQTGTPAARYRPDMAHLITA
jgi:uncharacterized protein